ncbi:MAG TPA: hypothetical protein VNZ58_07445 [Thermomicrobiales bacterium]|nr:hypothetical protein [Thermomicrobiales bacterium]
MTAQTKAAALRGALMAVGVFVVTLATARLAGSAWEPSIYTAVIGAGGVFGIRAGIEGLYDANRAKTGDVRDSDVQPLNVQDPRTWV